MNRWLITLLLAGWACMSSHAQVNGSLDSWKGRFFFQKLSEDNYQLRPLFLQSDSSLSENPRVIAIILDITLGLFGMHRLYLGTDLKVPVFYTLTFGGGGVLWLIDLGLLIFTPDISTFMNNPKLFMWSALPSEKKK